MDPPRIFQRALQLGLRIVAITDHNAVDNLPAFLKDIPSELWVIPGIEVQTREEIHLLALFETLETAMAFGDVLVKYLPDRPNVPSIFGEQIILNRQGEKQEENPRLLLTSVTLGIDEVLECIATFDAIGYPAHVDRNAFSIRSQLGFIPPGLPLPTVEVSYRFKGKMDEEISPGYQVIQSSDAHQISELGRGCSLFQMEKMAWEELKAAFCLRDGRCIKV